MAVEDGKHEPSRTTETSQCSAQSLPTEIFVDIFLRLPFDSLLRCRFVCKLWRSLISDPDFWKSHLALATTNNHNSHHKLIFSTGWGMNFKTCHLYDNSVNALDVDCLGKHPHKCVWIVGSCNGLVCIAINNYALIIWNPGTRHSNRLPYSGPQGPCVTYGFGYEKSNDDYKVIEISGKKETCIKICSLKNKSWKKIGALPPHDIIPLVDSAKFSNGALHWAARRLPYSWTIYSLDLATETIGEVLQPVYDEGNRVMSLGSLREGLCVLCNYGGNRLDLWVMQVYGVNDSWTKLASIPYLTDPRKCHFFLEPLCISNDGKITLQLGSELIVYDPYDASFSEIQILGDCVRASTFVESVVSPMPAAALGDGL